MCGISLFIAPAGWKGQVSACSLPLHDCRLLPCHCQQPVVLTMLFYKQPLLLLWASESCSCKPVSGLFAAPCCSLTEHISVFPTSWVTGIFWFADFNSWNIPMKSRYLCCTQSALGLAIWDGRRTLGGGGPAWVVHLISVTLTTVFSTRVEILPQWPHNSFDLHEETVTYEVIFHVCRA